MWRPFEDVKSCKKNRSLVHHLRLFSNFFSLRATFRVINVYKEVFNQVHEMRLSEFLKRYFYLKLEKDSNISNAEMLKWIKTHKNSLTSSRSRGSSNER